MDNTMSSYSFSQYFYQRWTCAPEPVRATITQELEDITTLLQTETPFESFFFNTHDLDAHIDELYENHEAEQAIAKAISDKQEEQAAIEQKRLDDEQKNQVLKDAKEKEEEAKRLEAAKTVQKESEKVASSPTNMDNPDNSAALTTNEIDKTSTDSETSTNDKDVSVDAHSTHKTISEHAATITDAKNEDRIKQDNIQAIQGKANAAISLAVKDTKLSTEHQSLIHELENQIDDYLSEQMMLMSEDLKSWLRAEMTQHLGEQDKVKVNQNTMENEVD